jgi:para-nitrobenzyl esterase
VRLLIGTNRDEMAMFTRPEAAGTPLAQGEMANLDLASAEPIYRRYAAAYPALSPLALRIRFLTAEEYWVPNMRIAQAHRQASAAGTAWVYRFDREATSSMFAGQVPHASELPYVWQKSDDPLYVQVFGPKDAVDRKIADEMHGRWVKFISGEAPDVPGAPTWPNFGDQEQILIFGENTMRGTLDKTELALWPE